MRRAQSIILISAPPDYIFTSNTACVDLSPALKINWSMQRLAFTELLTDKCVDKERQLDPAPRDFARLRSACFQNGTACRPMPSSSINVSLVLKKYRTATLQTSRCIASFQFLCFSFWTRGLVYQCEMLGYAMLQTRFRTTLAYLVIPKLKSPPAVVLATSALATGFAHQASISLLAFIRLTLPAGAPKAHGILLRVSRSVITMKLGKCVPILLFS